MKEEKKNSVSASIAALPQQCLQAWEETGKIRFPPAYSKAENVIFCGMGGSALPADVLQAVLATKVPLAIIRGYGLPAWANQKSLVFLSSYSGDTAEVVFCANQAQKANCLVTGATSGGWLAQFFRENNLPGYIFSPKHNPSGQPRLGLGYGIFALLGILDRIGLVRAVGGPLERQVKEAVAFLKNQWPNISEKADNLAQKSKDHILLIFGAEHLAGNAQIFAQQANETAKTFAAPFLLPEANHHLLEGLKRPKFAAAAIFLLSPRYSEIIRRRFELTAEIVRKSNFPTINFSATPGSLLQEVLETLTWSSLVTLKLAAIYKEDPAAIPWVDFFKERLKEIG